jgi:hypothetical protein
MQTTYTAWWFASPKKPSRWPAALVVAGLALAGWVLLHRGRAEVVEPVAAVSDWNGVWQSGDALIRLRGLRGEYSPDGLSVLPFRARAQGNNLWFSAKVHGKQMSLCLMRSGDTARLVGVQEYVPSTAPVVISPGGRQDREEEAERRREETRRLLTPTDLGTFRRQ